MVRGQRRRAGVPTTYSSWLNRIECEFAALRYFASTAPTTAATSSRTPRSVTTPLAQPTHRRHHQNCAKKSLPAAIRYTDMTATKSGCSARHDGCISLFRSLVESTVVLVPDETGSSRRA